MANFKEHSSFSSFQRLNCTVFIYGSPAHICLKRGVLMDARLAAPTHLEVKTGQILVCFSFFSHHKAALRHPLHSHRRRRQTSAACVHSALLHLLNGSIDTFE